MFLLLGEGQGRTSAGLLEAIMGRESLFQNRLPRERESGWEGEEGGEEALGKSC